MDTSFLFVVICTAAGCIFVFSLGSYLWLTIARGHKIKQLQLEMRDVQFRLLRINTILEERMKISEKPPEMIENKKTGRKRGRPKKKEDP